MKRKFVQLAGASLGFIANDLPGGYYGYYGAGKLYDWSMPPISRKRLRVDDDAMVSNAKNARGHFSLGGASRSHTRLGRRGGRTGAPRLYKALTSPIFLTSNTFTRVAATGGLQGAAYVNTWNGVSGANDVWLLNTTMHSDIRAALAATTYTQPTAFPNALATRKYMVDFAESTHLIKNTTTVPITMWLYDVTPRNDLATAPIQAWTNGITNQTVLLPNNDNTLLNTVVGSTPFQSTLFTRQWKVLNVTKVVLGGGNEHHHSIRVKPRYLFNTEETSTINQRGTTALTFVVHNGGIVSTGPALPNAISTSDSVLSIVTKTRCACRMFERSLSGYVQWDNLPKIPLASQQTVNEEQDAISTVQTL
uniref:Capsid protein n=1 Tax=Cressdnaviricota sp. TaxID=2748378 RepID=A0A6M3YP71_9VIRU|nr:MAG: capsid protein [Cressdnaviricota sp.]